MRLRLCAIAAAAGLAVAAFPAFASGPAAPKPQIVDPMGDANYINGQGILSTNPNQSTAPADASFADILSVTFATTKSTKTVVVIKGKKRSTKTVSTPTGFTVTMTLAAAPTVPEIFYRVSASTGSCATVFFEYSTAPNASPAGSARCAAALPNPSGPIAVTSVAVVGNSIVWTVPLSAFKVGTTFSSLDAQTRNTLATPVISLTAPQIDEGSSGTTYTVGQ
jgi:hypothetical protein